MDNVIIFSLSSSKKLTEEVVKLLNVEEGKTYTIGIEYKSATEEGVLSSLSVNLSARKVAEFENSLRKEQLRDFDDFVKDSRKQLELLVKELSDCFSYDELSHIGICGELPVPDGLRRSAYFPTPPPFWRKAVPGIPGRFRDCVFQQNRLFLQ